RTRRDQLATVVMSYHTHMPFKDYLIIGEETTLLYADGALRDRERVLVPKREGAEVDQAVVDQDAEFCAALRERREPAVSGRAVVGGVRDCLIFDGDDQVLLLDAGLGGRRAGDDAGDDRAGDGSDAIAGRQGRAVIGGRDAQETVDDLAVLDQLLGDRAGGA